MYNFFLILRKKWVKKNILGLCNYDTCSLFPFTLNDQVVFTLSTLFYNVKKIEPGNVDINGIKCSRQCQQRE